ncbi:hypothetical protein A3C87_03110 [Candidatus Kaiserbacteria bacterium RIFCSPHIGHO2_02_FULL_49_34]|uniref:Uncharacterized protein n=1 Tax=Candidatus Kaiserbacteria bacterium RIFCSPHIGHO2_02_FULL_49_34 TaxID=1798491 RepID=A0A1F6DI41_9BACT|nr:MAG: hypothetical protein A3C87_03110 [Candidatus Kaiserbacteria bacterium RIFCSPHIGHO2_02_FULL_49_34]
MTTTQVIDHDVVTHSVDKILESAVRARRQALRAPKLYLEHEEINVGWRVNLYQAFSSFPLTSKKVLAYVDVERKKPKQLSLTVHNSALSSGELKEVEAYIALLEKQLEGSSSRSIC